MGTKRGFITAEVLEALQELRTGTVEQIAAHAGLRKTCVRRSLDTLVHRKQAVLIRTWLPKKWGLPE